MSAVSSETREKNRQRERRRYREDASARARIKKRSRAVYCADPTKDMTRTRKWALENPERRRDIVLKSLHKLRGLPPPTRPRPKLCELCGRPSNGRGRLHLDHCRVTNGFRGWLCASCNLGLGSLGDQISRLKLAIAYLQRAARV